MTTAYITHPACVLHDMGAGHPECSERLSSIEDRLIATGLLDFLNYQEAPKANHRQLERVHDAHYIKTVLNFTPREGQEYRYLDPDTLIMEHTPEAALRAAGAVVLAAELVMSQKVKNAFCNVRPPGHHALRNQAMGFCFFNNVAVGVAHALDKFGLKRVAVCDFDVHHGNGTEDIFDKDARVMLCSSFQYPFYPYSPLNTHNPLIINAPLKAGADSEAFRQAISDVWLPALRNFEPQMLFISAGFDAHLEDEMSHTKLREADYVWVTEQLMEIANCFAQGRLVSVLEGGYALGALGRSASAHIGVLMGVQ